MTVGWDVGTVVLLNRFVVEHQLGWLVHLLGVELTYLFPLAVLSEWFRRDPARRRAAFAAGLALVLGAALYLTTNHLFARPRPDLGILGGGVETLINRLGSIDESAFPSGHATAGFAVAVALGVLEIRWFGWLVAASLVNVTARIAAGIHYPTDLVAGAALGTLAAALVLLNARRFDPLLRWLGGLSDRLVPFLPHPPPIGTLPSANKNPHP